MILDLDISQTCISDLFIKINIDIRGFDETVKKMEVSMLKFFIDFNKAINWLEEF